MRRGYGKIYFLEEKMVEFFFIFIVFTKMDCILFNLELGGNGKFKDEGRMAIYSSGRVSRLFTVTKSFLIKDSRYYHYESQCFANALNLSTIALRYGLSVNGCPRLDKTTVNWESIATMGVLLPRADSLSSNHESSLPKNLCRRSHPEIQLCLGMEKYWNNT